MSAGYSTQPRNLELLIKYIGQQSNCVKQSVTYGHDFFFFRYSIFVLLLPIKIIRMYILNNYYSLNSYKPLYNQLSKRFIKLHFVQ